MWLQSPPDPNVFGYNVRAGKTLVLRFARWLGPLIPATPFLISLSIFLDFTICVHTVFRKSDSNLFYSSNGKHLLLIISIFTNLIHFHKRQTLNQLGNCQNYADLTRDGLRKQNAAVIAAYLILKPFKRLLGRL